MAELEQMSRSWVNNGLAYVSLVTDERTESMKPGECLQMTAQRDFYMLTGEELLAFLSAGDMVCVDWLEDDGRWRIIRYESVRPLPASVSFSNPVLWRQPAVGQ